MKKKLIALSSLVFGLAPVLALAQISTGKIPTTCATVLATGVKDFQYMLCKISEIFGAVLPVLVGLGVIYFVWGVVSYVIASDEEAKKTGRDRIIYGLIGLAVIISMWGLVKILGNTFGLNNNQEIINYPTVPY